MRIQVAVLSVGLIISQFVPVANAETMKTKATVLGVKHRCVGVSHSSI